jgi:hypothetical protein
MRRRTSRARAAVMVVGTVGAVGAALGIGAHASAATSGGEDQGESSTQRTDDHESVVGVTHGGDDRRESRVAPATPAAPSNPSVTQGNTAQAPQAKSSGS